MSSLGDAKSLQGGTLLVTPLLGADGNVYAVGQGSVSIGGFQAEGAAASITRGVPTVGRIANGAIIEREIEFALNRLRQCAAGAAQSPISPPPSGSPPRSTIISAARRAEPIDPSTVQLTIPREFKGNVVALLTEIEQLQVEPDLVGQDRDRRAIRHHRHGPRRARRHRRGGARQPHRHDFRKPAGQPAHAAVARREPRSCPHSRRRQEDGKKFAMVKDGVSLQQLVDGLNALGIGPRDLIAHPAGDQGRRRDPGRHRGDVMQMNTGNSTHRAVTSQAAIATYNGRPDYTLADALTKVSPQAQAKAKTTATDFEAMFINQMFSQMTNGLKGEGPFGDTPGTGVWRSMLTEQYSKSFAKAGGIGISKDIFRELILQQAKQASQVPGNNT